MADPVTTRTALTGAQTGVWYAQQVLQGSAAYNVGQYVDLPGDLDPVLFETALRRAVRETETLRARIVAGQAAPGSGDESTPVQEIHPDPSWDLEVLDLRSAEDPRGTAEGWMRERMSVPVWGTGRLLFTFALLRVADHHWIWFQRYHHILVDAYAITLVNRRVAQIYSHGDGESTPAPRMRTLAEVVAEEEVYADSERRAEDQRYWTRALEGRPEPAVLGRAPSASANGSRREHGTLDADGLAALERVAGDAGANWAEALIAAYAAYVHRTTGHSDVVIGVPAMGRLGSASLSVPSMVVNILPLRLHITPGSTPVALVRQVSARLRELRAHQRYRAEDIRRDLGLVGRESGLHGPVVNIKAFDDDLRFGDVRAAARTLSEGPIDDLSLTVHPDRATGGLRFEYNANADGHTAEELGGRAAEFARFLDGFHDADASAEAPIALLETVSAGDSAAHRAVDRATERDLPTASVSEQISARARRTPDAVAVRAGREQLTYAELEGRAGRLAARLRAHGAGPEQVVAVALPRGVDLAVALLAVPRSGAAFLPLDPDFPRDRIAYMLEDAGVLVLLTDRELAGRLPQGTPRLLVDDPSDPGPGAQSPAPAAAAGDGLAYILYTSGSTGRPKGVAVSEQALRNFLADMAARVPLAPGDRWAAVTTIGFDISLLEVHLPLMAGATLDLVDRDTARDPRALAAHLDHGGCTVMQATPTLWRSLTDESPEALDGLRVLVGGEALPPDLAQDLTARASEVTNLYGPTETTIWSTASAVHPGEAVHIGHPVANTGLRVLDPSLRPVATGRPGDLYIAGQGLARGYVGRADLTSERFVADPFGPPGSRMYRTGDLVRRRPDGALDYLGRTDHQIKVRGFRIEPGEIENALGDVPGVGQCVVVAREDRTGGTALVGYAVPAPGHVLDTSAVRTALSERLPHYMVPAAIVALEAFPLTENRKIDRKALPEPDLDPAHLRGGEPSNADEETLCALFAEVLGLDRVGTHDNFFALGGHSLLAARLAHRVRERMACDIGLRDVFGAATVSELATRLHPANGTDAAPTARTRPARPPLSPAQRRLWFLEKLNGPSPVYNVPVALRLHGEIDPGALSLALRDTVLRHESLRTVHTDDGDEAFQDVLPAEALPDLLEVAKADEDGLAARMKERVHRPFDIAAEAPARATLFRLGAREHVLLLVVHHIATDEGSEQPLLRDLDTAYRHRRRGEEPRWPERGADYIDHTLGQWERLGSPADPDSTAARLAGEWRAALAGAPEETALPTDRTRPAQADGRGAVAPFRITAATTARLGELARKHGATEFMVLHAALACQLRLLGAGEDVTVGTPIANRDDAVSQDLVGLFLNMVPLRMDVSGDVTFEDLLLRARAADTAAYARAELPFDQIVEAVAPAREAGRHPLFQVMLSHQHEPGGSQDLFGTHVEPQRVQTDTAKVDLEFTVVELPGADELVGELRYATDLFDHGTAQLVAERFGRLLETVLAEPRRPLAEIDPRTGAEVQRLTELNDTAAPVHAGLLGQRPDGQDAWAHRVALVEADSGAVLDYVQFRSRVNRLARVLVDRGVGPGDVVAVGVPRSVDLVVALHAVVVAGGAYLPLDLEYPPERLRFVLEDAAPRVVLTTVADAGTVPEGFGERLLLDAPEAADLLARTSGAELAPAERRAPVHPQDLAYVIYTSGSTGRPKGVGVSHEAIINRLEWMQHRFPLSGDDRVLQKTPSAFDVSVWEFFWPLRTGAALVVAPPGGHRDPAHLARVIRERQVTTCHFVPSMLRVFLDEPTAADCTGLSRVFASGEALPTETAKRFRRTLPRTGLFNLYGPTEAAVDVTWFDAFEDVGRGSVPIGRPVHNTRVHVLDDLLRPVPDGVAGDLYLAGTQLARGYQGRFGLSAERFVADPFGRPGTRMYRTGDLARFRHGVLEFVGRSDFQVKVRGQRIELGEIEAALAAAPGVSGAVATVAENASGEQVLVGHISGRATRDHDTSFPRVREAVAEALPEYMVPSVLVAVEEWPLSPNGKLDRSALPAPDLGAGAGQGRAAETPVEQALCQVYAEVLRLPEVGADDDFFRLGGDSISSIQVVNRLHREGWALEVADVFSARTPAALARAAVPVDPDRDATQVFGADLSPWGELPVTPIGHWLLDRGEHIHTVTQRQVVATPAGLTQQVLTDALADVIDRHDALRMCLNRSGGGPVLEIRPPGSVHAGDCVRRVPVQHERSGALTAEVVGAAETAARDLDADAGVLLRAVWFDAGDRGAGRLLLIIHHLAVDGVSWRVLLPDLEAAVEVRTHGRSPVLSAPGTPLRAWASALEDAATTARWTDQMPYWRGVLAGGAEEPGDGSAGLPAVDPGQDTVETAHTVTGLLDADTTAAVLDRVTDAYSARPDDVLLSALALAVHAWRDPAGSTEGPLLVDVEGHGREDLVPGADLSRTVGWFTSLYPVRLDLGGPGAERVDVQGALAAGPAAGQALKRVKETLRSVPDGGVGFGVLRHLNPGTAGELAEGPRPGLLFNYLGRMPAASGRDWELTEETWDVPLEFEPKLALTHGLALNAVAEDGPEGLRLRARWTFARRLWDEERVRALLDGWFEALRALVSHTGSDGAGGHTPSDFAMVDLQQGQVDQLEALLRRRR